MSGFLLDINIPSELVRPQPEPKVKTWLAAQSLESLFISSVSFGELRKGILLVTFPPCPRRSPIEPWREPTRHSFPHQGSLFGPAHQPVWREWLATDGLGGFTNNFGHLTPIRSNSDPVP